jgi:hypothetical protein
VRGSKGLGKLHNRELEGRDDLEDQRGDLSIILKQILRKWGVEAWLRTRTRGEIL